MRRIALVSLFVVMSLGISFAQAKNADIKFEKTTHNVGEFPEKKPVTYATFKFTNVGNAPLVIHQVVASCGCTVPTYSKEPILPGKTGEVKVTYDGTDKPLGFFKKSIIVRSNAKTPTTRLFIEGTMVK